MAGRDGGQPETNQRRTRAGEMCAVLGCVVLCGEMCAVLGCVVL